jgi:import inner membrane translocase subunit TIM44
LVDDAKDVLAVALGIERQRDIETEYDMGLREYPWVRYTDAASGKLVYRNRESGATMDEAPKDWSRRATPAHEIAVQSSASSIATIKNAPSAWERTIKALGETPIIAGLLAAGTAVREGPVGKAAAKAAQRADEIREDLQEKWETSQHPIIVNSAYVVDSLIAETEQGRALRDIKALDSGFDEFEFISDMRDNFIPRIATAFFRLDNAVLAAQCRETALAQMKAVAAARETEGLRHDGTVLSVSKVELMQAKQLEDAGGGTLPLLLVSAQVQYIHAVRNKVVRVVTARRCAHPVIERSVASRPAAPSPHPPPANEGES